jgi:hypothetical protein
VVLGFGGDLGFSGNDQPLAATGAIRHGKIIPWAELTSGLAPLLEADATFANLETVITDRNDLVPADRSFNFAASPEGVFAVARAGINVLATANNHAADYGGEGILETLRHLELARAHGLKAHAGLGVGEERYHSDVFQLGDVRVAIAAIGKGVNPAEPDGPGQPLQARPIDFERVGLSLVGTGAQKLAGCKAHIETTRCRDNQKLKLADKPRCYQGTGAPRQSKKPPVASGVSLSMTVRRLRAASEGSWTVSPVAAKGAESDVATVPGCRATQMASGD